MNLELRDPVTGKFNPLILVAGAGAVLLGLYSLSKGGSGSSSGTSGSVESAGLSSGITDQLATANEAAIALAARLSQPAAGGGSSGGPNTGTGTVSNPNSGQTGGTPLTTPTGDILPTSGVVGSQQWLNSLIASVNTQFGLNLSTPTLPTIPGNTPASGTPTPPNTGGVNLPEWEPQSQSPIGSQAWLNTLLASVGVPFLTNPTSANGPTGQQLSAYAAGIVSTGGGGDSTFGNLSSYILSPNDVNSIAGYNITSALPEAVQQSVSPGLFSTIFNRGGNTDVATIQAPATGLRALVAQVTGSAPTVPVVSPVTGPSIAPNFNSAESIASVLSSPTVTQQSVPASAAELRAAQLARVP